MSVETTKTSPEKFLKLGDGFVSDEGVHLDEQWLNWNATSWPIFIEGYVNGCFGIEVRYSLIAREGRVPEELGEGGEAQEVRRSPPSEVASETAPSHRLGGYTAKHTRLGSPEDA